MVSGTQIRLVSCSHDNGFYGLVVADLDRDQIFVTKFFIDQAQTFCSTSHFVILLQARDSMGETPMPLSNTPCLGPCFVSRK